MLQTYPKWKPSILATLYHCISTVEKPNHGKCPAGQTLWCFYQHDVANNTVLKSHKLMKTRLTEDIVSKILPVYQRLASDDLLLWCISAKTQNANETLHSCIWKKCPKELFVSKKRIELAVTSAVSEFNLGCVELLKMMCKESASSDSKCITKRRNVRRSKQNEHRSLESYTKPKIQKKKFKN